MITFNHILPKWNHTTARGGLHHLDQTAPPMSNISHLLAVLRKDPRIIEVHLSMATLQVTDHPPQDSFTTTQLTGGQAQHHPIGGLSGAIKGSQVFSIRSNGVVNLEGISAPEKGPMSTRVMAWNAGMRLDRSLIHKMENTDPLGAPERCMGEARCQRGTGVKQQSQLGKIIKEEAWSWPSPPSHRGRNDYLYSAPALIC